MPFNPNAVLNSMAGNGYFEKQKVFKGFDFVGSCSINIAEDKIDVFAEYLFCQ
jgi:hypothetical protein